LEYIPTVQD